MIIFFRPHPQQPIGGWKIITYYLMLTWSWPGGGRVFFNSPHASLALCNLGAAVVDIGRLVAARTALVRRAEIMVALFIFKGQRSGGWRREKEGEEEWREERAQPKARSKQVKAVEVLSLSRKLEQAAAQRINPTPLYAAMQFTFCKAT